VTDQAIALLAPRIGTRAACAASGVAQASWYRRHRASPAPPRRPPVPHRERRQPRALSPAERAAILTVLHSPRFADTAPAEAWATLLDEGTYLGSLSTFYRLLRAAGETRERRAQATHPAAVKPELVATGPNQVWSWDITKLRGPAKWTYYYLYVIPGIHSRYAVGWMVATCESAALAEKLIAATVAKQGISRGQLTIHADRGSSMTSKPVTFLLAGPRHHPVPLPAARQQRQPVLRSAVQDPQIPARIPGPLHLDRGRPGTLPGLLPLV
jgi:putative transposase